jgi:hypothetical protein
MWVYSRGCTPLPRSVYWLALERIILPLAHFSPEASAPGAAGAINRRCASHCHKSVALLQTVSLIIDINRYVFAPQCSVNFRTYHVIRVTVCFSRVVVVWAPLSLLSIHKPYLSNVGTAWVVCGVAAVVSTTGTNSFHWFCSSPRVWICYLIVWVIAVSFSLRHVC